MNFKQITQSVGGFIGKNSPVILTVVSSVGVVATTVFAVQATPKATRLIEDELARKEWAEGLNLVDKAKIAWRPYVPAAIMGAATIASIIGANAINTKRNAALSSAYILSETALKNYKDKVIEKFGETKHREVTDEIAQDRVDKTYKAGKTEIIAKGGGVLCNDMMSGRYFRSSMNQLQKYENEINKHLMDGDWFCLNEVYGIMDMEPISAGWDIGWDINRDGKIEFTFTTCLADNDEPCIVFDFSPSPIPKWC